MDRESEREWWRNLNQNPLTVSTEKRWRRAPRLVLVWWVLAFAVAQYSGAARSAACEETAETLLDYARTVQLTELKARENVRKLCRGDPECNSYRGQDVAIWAGQQVNLVEKFANELRRQCSSTSFAPQAAHVAFRDKLSYLTNAIAALQVIPTKSANIEIPPAPSSLQLRRPPANQVVEVLFGTDRAEDPKAKPANRFTASRGELRLGVATVSIPAFHKIGEVERPRWYRLEFAEDPASHVVLLAINTMSPSEFSSQLALSIQSSTEASAFIFVHGYNVSFEDAALRAAQMAVDLGMKSVPIFYSWPSQGSFPAYPVDGQNAEWTEHNLRLFLATVADQLPAKELFVIAHSMGAQAVTRALGSLLRERADLRARFREVVLAAPDIDAAVFKRDLLPPLAAANQRVTLYASSNDKALKASKKFNGNPRAGETGPELVVQAGLDTIDASNVDTDFFGHSYFATRTLLTDLALLLHNNLRALQRPTLEKHVLTGNVYWEFRR